MLVLISDPGVEDSVHELHPDELKPDRVDDLVPGGSRQCAVSELLPPPSPQPLMESIDMAAVQQRRRRRRAGTLGGDLVGAFDRRPSRRGPDTRLGRAEVPVAVEVFDTAGAHRGPRVELLLRAQGKGRVDSSRSAEAAYDVPPLRRVVPLSAPAVGPWS